MTFPPLPVHTLDFVRSLADEDLLGILRSANVKLPPAASGAAISRPELEKRAKLMLSDCQRLKNMLPLGQVTYPELSGWTPYHDSHAGQGNDAQNTKISPRTTSNISQAFREFYTLKESLKFRAMQDNMPGFVDREVGEHAFTDAGRTLLSLAGTMEDVLPNGIENAAFLLQDEAQTSGIALRIISICGCPGDPSNPIFFVLFHHETREHVISSSLLVDIESVSPTLRWVKSCMAETDTAVGQIDCSLNAQHLILRQLLYNARRVPADYKPTFNKFRRGALVHFTPSFILPLRPVSPAMLGHLSRPLKHSDCAAANCPGAFVDAGICSRCGVIQYCSTSCQSRDLPSHAPFCRRISRSKVVSFEACPLSDIGQYVGVFNLGSTTSDMVTTHSMSDHAKAGLAESRKKHPNQRLFLINVQVSLGGTGPLMVYDRDKTFIVQVHPPREGGDERDAIAFKAMENLSRKCTRWRGLKVFLYARHSRAGDTRLEVLTDVLPGQEVPW
ncbi:hypothetical protein EV426DRAFT_209025 [Tirmania nivea]|nr:hypothetical protein EV426DRAFT_209025 [Tirmania nivea]